MMSAAYFFPALFFMVLFQNSFAPAVSIAGISPDFLLIFLVWHLSKTHRLSITLWSFFAGLLQGFFDVEPLGIIALCKAIALFAAASVPWQRYEKGIRPFLYSLILAAFVHNAVYFLFINQASQTGWFGLFLRYGFPSVVYTVIAAGFCKGVSFFLPVLLRKYVS